MTIHGEISMKSRRPIALCFAGVLALVALVSIAVSAGVSTLFPVAMPMVTQMAASGGVPLQMNHQGVVRVNGVPFNGSGHFHFALVDPDSGNNLWTNDGSNLGTPNRPTTPVEIDVVNGLYSVRLGHTQTSGGPAGMTEVIPTSVFDDDNVVLRIWFDDTQGNGIELLSPDHVLTSAPYTFTAAFATNAGDASTAALATNAGDADTVDGIHASDLEESNEIDSDIAAHASDSSAHHARYTDAEAIAAVTSSPIGTAPIGSVVAWLKSFTNTPALPDGWVECNGQTLSDGTSVYNGQTIPNLNASGGGAKRFLRGATSSGNTGGSEEHTHFVPAPGYNAWTQTNDRGWSGVSSGATSSSASTLPSYYEVIWILRVK